MSQSNSSSNTLTGSRSFVADVQNLDKTDPNYASQLEQVCSHHGVRLPSDSCTDKQTSVNSVVTPHHNHRNSLMPSFGFNNFMDPFAIHANHMNQINNLHRAVQRRTQNVFDMFNHQFNNFGTNFITSFSNPDIEELENDINEVTQNDNPVQVNEEGQEYRVEEASDMPRMSAYSKYTQSYTNFGPDGKKQQKVISSVEKIEDGKRTFCKKMVSDDGENVVVEKVLPNGKQVTTTTKSTNNQLMDK